MGIPSFYRWLSERFPLCVVDAVDQPIPTGGGDVPANPNGVEFDNLYLDMNGVIHPCFHPENGPCPESYDHVFQAIFLSIDKLISIVRPRKILFIAIDGVAPRAKMNQQRSRRFRAAKDAASEAKPEEPGCETRKELFDSNIITPGTEFMALLASALRGYIDLRMNGGSQLWQRLKVILSDSNVPGEGEHKIMSYIRLQRNLPGYDPNTRHCLYGLDADLIMLALASHEIHFSILREDKKHNSKAAAKVVKSKCWNKPRLQKFLGYFSNQEFKFIHVWIVREYLAHILKIPGQKRGDVDLERLIDDFVLMCLFVGNDFLPHMPTLDIIEGAIDLLMEIYKQEFSRMGGYLTNSSEVNLGRVKHFLVTVGQHEDIIFKERGRLEKKRTHPSGFSQQKGRSNGTSQQRSQQSRPSQNSIPQNIGNVNYDQPGWKNRYYDVKLDAKTDEDRGRIRSDVVLKYTEGICWVMNYYYKSVCSWQWFYPYHYAPFASDFHDTEMATIQFTLGEPFKPFDQLMAVLPTASAHALPPSYQKLMTDPLSPLAPFYPEDFELDMNDKKLAWQAICKLPFIEESLLLSEIAKFDHTLTEEESKRNTLGSSVLFIHGSHSLAEEIVSLYLTLTDHTQITKHEINPKFSDGVNGYVFIPEKLELLEKIESQITSVEELKDNKVMSLVYEFPPFHPHISRIPEGAQLPSKTVRLKDIPPRPLLWHERSTAVGRLHSVSSIPHSLSGPHLQQAARRLVLTWLLGAKQGSEIPEGGGIHSWENITQPKKEARLAGTDTTNNDLVSASSVIFGYLGYHRQLSAPFSTLASVCNHRGARKHNAKIVAEESRPVVLQNAKPAGNDVGMTSSTVTQAPTTTDSISNLRDTTFVPPNVSSIQTSADKNSSDGEAPVKDNNEGKVVRKSNAPIDVGGTAPNEIKDETGSDCKSEKKSRRTKKKAKLAGTDVGMTSSTVTQAPTTTDSISNFGDTKFVPPNVSSIQTSADKNSIDGKAPVKDNNEGKVVRKSNAPIDVGGTATNEIKGETGSDCKSEKKSRRAKKKAKLAGTDVGMTSSTATQAPTTTDTISNLRDTTFVPPNVSSIQTSADKNSIDGEAPVKDNDEGKVVRQTNVPIDVGGTATNEIKRETGSDCKSEKKQRRTKKKAKPAGNAIGMTSSTSTQAPSTTALIPNSGDTSFATSNTSSIQTSPDKNSIDGDDPVKDSNKGKAAPENNVKEAIDVNGTATNTRSDCKSEKKRKRTKKKAKIACIDINKNDVGMTSSAVTQTTASISNLGDTIFATPYAFSNQTSAEALVKDNDEGKAAPENNVQEAIDVCVNQRSIEGEVGNSIMPTVEVIKAEESRSVVLQDQVKDTGEAVSDCKLGKKRRRIKKKAIVPSVDDNNNDLGTTRLTQIQTKAEIVPDFGKGSVAEESRLVLTQDPVKENDEGNVVSNKNVREAIGVGGIKTPGNTRNAESGCKPKRRNAESGCKPKRRRPRKKARLDNVVVVSVGA